MMTGWGGKVMKILWLYALTNIDLIMIIICVIIICILYALRLSACKKMGFSTSNYDYRLDKSSSVVIETQQMRKTNRSMNGQAR